MSLNIVQMTVIHVRMTFDFVRATLKLMHAIFNIMRMTLILCAGFVDFVYGV
jgi:hypothetical protein